MSDYIPLDWDDLPDEPYYAAATRNQLREFMKSRSRRKWNRLQRDFRWLQLEMVEAGLNPEDARFLL